MSSANFRKWDEVNHPIITKEDWNGIVDYVLKHGNDDDNSSTPITIAPSFTLAVGDEGYGTPQFTTWVVVTVKPILESYVAAYIIQYRPHDAEGNWFYLIVPQSGSDIIVQTPNLAENETYDFRVAGINQTNDIGVYSEIQSITTSTNNVAYPVPTEVIAMDMIRGVSIKWRDLYMDGYTTISYNVYRSTGTDFHTSTLEATVTSPLYYWNIKDVMNDYVPQNFWVTSVSPSGVESDHSLMVTATPMYGTIDPSTESPTFTLTNKSDENGLYLTTWVEISIDRKEKVTTATGECRVKGYLFQYTPHDNSTEEQVYTEYVTISQPASGNAIGVTKYLKENTEYDFMACYVNDSDVQGVMSAVQTIKTIANTFKPPTITNLEANGVIDGVALDWDALGYSTYAFYRVYESKTNTASTATLVSEMTLSSPSYTWRVKDFNADFTTHYFWVTAVNSSGTEGDWCASVSATPIKGMEQPPTEAPTFTLTNVNNANSINFKAWVKVDITRLNTASTTNGTCSISGYVVEYKKHSDTIYLDRLEVSQPATGNAIVMSSALTPNTLYDFRVCGVNANGMEGVYGSSTITTSQNNIKPDIVTGLSALTTLNGVYLEWDSVGLFENVYYNIYKNTSDDDLTATLVGTSKTASYVWFVNDNSTDFITQYFWVTVVTSGGQESNFQISSVSAIPTRGIEKAPTTAPEFTLTNQSNGETFDFKPYVKVDITRMDTSATEGNGTCSIGGYVVKYKVSTDTLFSRIDISQPVSGDITALTATLEKNTLYDFKVCAVNLSGIEGVYSDVTQITTVDNTIKPSVITGLTASGIVNGVFLEWSSVGLYNGVVYKIYKNTIDSSTTATCVAETRSASHLWAVVDNETDYVSQYFWVTVTNNGGVESDLGNSVNATPVKGIEKPATETPAFTLTSENNANAVTFKTWVKVVITRMSTSNTTNGKCSIGSYVVQYKKSSDTTFNRMVVAQSTSGNLTVITPSLEENTAYDFKLCAVNSSGIEGTYSSVSNVTTSSNTFTPSAVTGLVAYPKLNGVLIEWDSLGLLSNIKYKIYKGLVNDSSLATVVGYNSTSSFVWNIADSDTDYVTQYFWVTVVNSGNQESTYSTSVNATPIKGIDKPPTTVPEFTLTAQSNANSLDFKNWVKVDITRIDTADTITGKCSIGGYVIQYKQTSDTSFSRLEVSQPSSGNIVVLTPYLVKNTSYDFKVCAVNFSGIEGIYSDITQVTTIENITVPEAVTNLSATGLVNSVLIEWDSVGLYNDVYYKVYKNTSDSSSTATCIAETRSANYLWNISNSETDYVSQYFWVTVVNNGAQESLLGTSVNATPTKGIEKPATETPSFTLTAKNNADSIYFKTWVEIALTRMETSNTTNGKCTIGSYVVQYKKSSESIFNRMVVAQSPSGNLTLITPMLEENTTYNFKICAVNSSGIEGTYSNISNVTTSTNTVVPSTISGLTAYAKLGGVLLEWTSIGLLSNTTYKIYKALADNSATASVVGYSKTPSFNWNVSDNDKDYVAQYFWVTIVNSGEVESLMGASVHATPIKNLELPASTAPEFTVTNQSNSNALNFDTWAKIDITRMATSATSTGGVTQIAGYIVQYKVHTDTLWSHITVDQSASGNITVITPLLNENTSYDYKVCAVNISGVEGTYSEVVTQTSSTNNGTPSTIAGLSATSILNGVLLSWTSVGILSDSYYKIYRNTSNNSSTATLIGTSTTSGFKWDVINQSEDFVTQYFWVTIINSGGVESVKGTAVSSTPIEQIIPEVGIELRPWTSNIKIWEDETVFGKLYWADSAGTANATIAYSNGTTATITKNLTGTSFSAGVVYLYVTDGNTNLLNTTDYSQAVGIGKHLVAVLTVNTTRHSTIYPYNSYTPTIGAGAIAIGVIDASHVRTDTAIITDSLQIGSGLITNDKLNSSVTLNSNKIILNGAVTLSDWQSTGTTTINGAKVTTGTITADKLLSGCLGIGNFDETTQDKIASGESAYTLTELWKYGETTYINGGSIYANTITANKLNIVGIDSSTGKLDPTQFTTTINGNQITTGTLTASQIQAGTLTGDRFVAKTITGSYIADGTLDNSKLNSSVTLSADKIILQGSTTFANSLGVDSADGVTKIDGGKLIGHSITADQIAAGTIAVGALSEALQTELNNMASTASTALSNAATAQQTAEDAQLAADNAQTAANNAQSSADNAISDAATANSLLADIASDSKLTPIEKASTKLEWDTIVSEKSKIDTQADTFGVSKTAYGVAYTALSDYITSLLSNLTTTSDIVGTVFRGKFKDYYDSRTDILNEISAKARTLANTAQDTADTAISNALTAQNTADTAITNAANAQLAADNAQSAADSAQSTADSAVSSAATANALLSDLSNDNKLTPLEKSSVKLEWDSIVSEKIKIDAQADTFSVSKTAYGTAYSALNTYITPLLVDLSVTSDIVGSTFRSTFKTYYDARTDILNAISDKARTLANTAQSAADEAQSTADSALSIANNSAATLLSWCYDNNLTYINGANIYSGTINAAKLNIAGIDATTGKLKTDQFVTTIDGDKITTGSITGNLLHANTITGDRLAVGTITGTYLAGGSVDNSKLATSVTLTADKIVLDGSVYLSDWKSSGTGVTTINGGKITAGSITADKLLAGSITIGNFDADTQARIASGETANALTELWEYGDTTYINGGIIHAGTIEAGQLHVTGISADGKLDPSKFSTKIIGDYIETGTITALNIDANTITGDRIAIGTIQGIYIGDEAIDNSKLASSVTLSADKIMLDGSVSISSWKTQGYTTINGGAITANSITVDKLATDVLSVGNFSQNVLDRMFSSSSLQDIIEAWRETEGNGTFIKGGSIFAGSITANKLLIESIDTDIDSPTYGKVKPDQFTTKIEGNQISTGAITAELLRIDSIDTDPTSATYGKVKPDQFTTKISGNQINTGAITNDHVLNISANKVILSGSTTFASLLTQGTTTIDGGKITSGSIAADRLASGALAVGNFSQDVIDRLFNSSDSSSIIQAWRDTNGDGTFIDGGKIYAGSIKAASCEILGLDENGRLNLNHSNGTFIEGDRISTGSITAKQIQSGTITGDLLQVGAIEGKHIGSGVIDNGHLSTQLTLSADKIMMLGTVAMSSLLSDGTTTIDGGKITANSITADKIVTGCMAIGHFDTPTQIKIQNGDAAKVLTDLWRDNEDITLINGGNIKTNTIEAKCLAIYSVDTDPDSPTYGKLKTDQFATKINGSEIATGSITAELLRIGSIDTDPASSTYGKVKPDQLTTKITGNQIETGTITNEHILSLRANKLKMYGEVTFETYLDTGAGGVTTIKGGKITANSINADRLAAGTLAISNFRPEDVANWNIFNAWKSGANATYIDGGHIYARSITSDQITTKVLTSVSIGTAENVGQYIPATGKYGSGVLLNGNGFFSFSGNGSKPSFQILKNGTAICGNDRIVMNENGIRSYNQYGQPVLIVSNEDGSLRCAYDLIKMDNSGIKVGSYMTITPTSFNAGGVIINSGGFYGGTNTVITGGTFKTGSQVGDGTSNGNGVIISQNGIYGYSQYNTSEQFAINAYNGKATCGYGNVILDEGGITVNNGCITINNGTINSASIDAGTITGGSISGASISGGYFETQSNYPKVIISSAGSGCYGTGFNFYSRSNGWSFLQGNIYGDNSDGLTLSSLDSGIKKITLKCYTLSVPNGSNFSISAGGDVGIAGQVTVGACRVSQAGICAGSSCVPRTYDRSWSVLGSDTDYWNEAHIKNMYMTNMRHDDGDSNFIYSNSPLHIAGSAGCPTSTGNYLYLRYGDTNTSADALTGTNVSLYCADSIVTRDTLYAYSDQRDKNYLCELYAEDALEKVNKLRPLYFRWKPNVNHNTNPNVGFFAQEVEKIIPEAVSVTEDKIRKDGRILNYNALTTYAVSAIQELHKKMKTLEKEVVILREQTKEINSLKAEIEMIKKKIFK